MTILTIVTISLNNLDGLKRTFTSLATQTYQDVEHLVIDGGSTDGSAEWARLNIVFPDTRVLSELDGGIYDAMNKGLRSASGEILYYLNSGDCVASPTVLKLVVEDYQQDNWAWAFGMAQMVDWDFLPVRVKQQPSYSWWRQTFWHYTIAHQAVFMQVEFLKDLGGFDERFALAADYHAITRAGRNCCPKVLTSTVALTLEGGVTDRNVAAAHMDIHAARVDALALTKSFAQIDRAWTAVLIAKTRLRRLLRRLLRLTLHPGSQAGPKGVMK